MRRSASTGDASSDAPQLMQNRAAAGFGVPQDGQRRSTPASLGPSHTPRSDRSRRLSRLRRSDTIVANLGSHHPCRSNPRRLIYPAPPGRRSTGMHGMRRSSCSPDADRDGDLSGADLESLAEAAWFTGHAGLATDAKERAFKAYPADGEADPGRLLRPRPRSGVQLPEEAVHRLRVDAPGRAAPGRRGGKLPARLPCAVSKRGREAGGGHRHRARTRRRGRPDRRQGRRRRSAGDGPDRPRFPQDRHRRDLRWVRADGGGHDRRRERRAVPVRHGRHVLHDDLRVPRPDRLPAGERVDRGDGALVRTPVGLRVPRGLPRPPSRGRGSERRLGARRGGAASGHGRARRLQRGAPAGRRLLRDRGDQVADGGPRGRRGGAPPGTRPRPFARAGDGADTPRSGERPSGDGGDQLGRRRNRRGISGPEPGCSRRTSRSRSPPAIRHRRDRRPRSSAGSPRPTTRPRSTQAGTRRWDACSSRKATMPSPPRRSGPRSAIGARSPRRTRLRGVAPCSPRRCGR